MTITGKYVVGVDMGGSYIRAGAVDPDGNLLSFVKQPTDPSREVGAVICQICDAVRSSVVQSGRKQAEILGVAVGACGLVDRGAGRFVSSSVIPTWENVPLTQIISQSLGMPVLLDNDANAAVFGEWWAGVGRGTSHLIGMTLGTGIGGGAVLGGSLFYGSHGNAGEFGHMTVDPNGPACFCGNHGCLGLLASAMGMVRTYQQLSAGAPAPTSPGCVNLTARAIYDLAVSGDEAAHRAILQTGRYLAIGTANLLNCFNPDMVVFTGGMTRMGQMLLGVIREEARRRVYPPIFRVARIEFGQLDDTAGVVGSAGIFFRSLDEQIQ